MGYGGKGEDYTADYYKDDYDAKTTNGGHDVSVLDPSQLNKDLAKIGFSNFQYDIRDVGPGDNHKNWIWVRTKK